MTAEDALDAIAAPLERIFASLEATAELLGARRPRRRRDLKPLKALLHAHLAEHAPLLAGTGVILAPGVLSDAPRWLEWYWRAERDSPPRFLTVELNPAHPDHYDYEHAAWFEEPRRTGRRAVAGPHVDYGATRQHLVTPSLPIVAGGEFLGVAAADVRVGELEPVVLGALGGLEAVLVNAEGRVIAGNSVRHLAGCLVRDPVRIEARALPWALVLPTTA